MRARDREDHLVDRVPSPLLVDGDAGDEDRVDVVRVLGVRIERRIGRRQASPETQHPGLEHRPGEHRAGRRRRLGVGQRQPDMQRPETRLQAQADQQQAQAERVDRLGLPAGEVERLPGRVATQQQPGEQQHLAAQRQLQVQARGAARAGRYVLLVGLAVLFLLPLYLLVRGAVGMVEEALKGLAEREIVELDSERKAAMVSNLLVVLCSERATQPVVNAGSLYPALHRLERAGYLQAQETTPARGGPSVRTYALTDTGRAELRRRQDSYQSFDQAMRRLWS